MHPKNMLGIRSGRLVAVRYLGNSVWECNCDCGGRKNLTQTALTRASTTSCGCHHGNLDHGMSGTPTYESWAHMVQRCTNPKVRQYRWYGARGISVAKDWYEFPKFLADMGERPTGHTLDRINPHEEYSKTNCRWAPTNTGRRRDTPMVGKQTIGEYAKKHNLNYHTAYARYRKGTL